MSSRKEQLHKFIIPRYTVEGFRQKLEPDLCRKFDGLMGSADIQTRTHQRLQDQLADKQEEYDAVCAQERGTLDPTAKIRLQRQMTQLEMEMDEIEQEIKAHRFKVMLDSAEREEWLERLMLCVKPELYYKWTLIEMMPVEWEEVRFQELWKKCSEEHIVYWRTDRSQELRIQLVETLWQWPLSIANLVFTLESDPQCNNQAISKWWDDLCKDDKFPSFHNGLYREAQQKKKRNQSTPLSVCIETPDPNGSQKIELSTYIWDERGEATSLSEESQLPRPPNKLHEVPNYLSKILGHNYLREINVESIEIFLPLDLLTYDIGQWLEGDADFQDIVDKRHVIIRILERQSASLFGEAYQQWCRRWEQLKGNEFCLSHSCVSWFGYYPNNLRIEQRKLRQQGPQNLQTCLAIGFTIGQHIQKKDFFETMILSSGMPVAVWLHSSDSCQEELKALLQACTTQHFCTKIHQLQREIPLQLGRQVALLWDDPNRMLPPWHSYADDASL